MAKTLFGLFIVLSATAFGAGDVAEPAAGLLHGETWVMIPDNTQEARPRRIQIGPCRQPKVFTQSLRRLVPCKGGQCASDPATTMALVHAYPEMSDPNLNTFDLYAHANSQVDGNQRIPVTYMISCEAMPQGQQGFQGQGGPQGFQGPQQGFQGPQGGFQGQGFQPQGFQAPQYPQGGPISPFQAPPPLNLGTSNP